ncbi:MAG TPA: OmpA family protein [Bacteroidales bacterium]|jgi:outer membrane protein OmpA-like peptidoglycan-associated protein|nr:OmpA family protein [Bacteroidales bacterium]
MKYPIFFSALFALLMILVPEAKSQVKVDVKDKVNREADHRANRATDRVVDAGFDKLEEGIKGVFKKKDKKTKDAADDEVADSENQVKPSETETDEPGKTTDNKSTQKSSSSLSWSRYDFLPGDQVIFEDNLEKEENGEFPSGWDLKRGNAETAELDGSKVIMLRDGSPQIVPYFKDPGEDHLPDVFTIELDLLYKGEYPFEIYLYDMKNQESTSPSGYTHITVSGNGMSLGTASSEYPDKAKDPDIWRHISIAYTDGKLKAYLDDTRLVNIPRLDFNPSGLTLHAYHASDENHCYVKNVRIAKGGVKYYDRVMQDGKIIVNGIRFDVNKSTLKPESMGAINEIYTLMKDNPDLKFSVEGHTDSQGDDAFNQKLSEDRAKTVLNTLIKMGISADRLTSKGWGESKPISNNASPEDMANNRRVEFVKI